MKWSKEFDKWLKKEGRTALAYAQHLGVSPSLIHYWRTIRRPRSAELRKRIERESFGCVKADLMQ